MEPLFRSGGEDLVGVLARPRRGGGPWPAVILCHDFPLPGAGRDSVVRTMPDLAERLAREMEWLALAFAFRGCDGSGGDFSLDGWLSDVLAAIDELFSTGEASGLWLAGMGTGGALALCAAAQRPEVKGVAALGAPADFDDWAGHPRRLVQHSRELGIVRSPDFPPSLEAFSKPLREIRAVRCAAELAPRPLLLLHGADDDLVPVFDARVMADAHGDAELRILTGSGHQLRDDPRAVAILLAWLDRQRHRGAQAAPRGPGS